MYKSYKVEIKLTDDQKIKVNKSMGICRFIYNFYITENKKQYEKDGTFISAFTFSKWLNNEFIPNNPEYMWIKDAPAISIKQSMIDAERAFKLFFKGLTGFPRYKKKKINTRIYLLKKSKTDFKVERHRIKIPSFKYIRLKEYGYIPLNANIKSCAITKKADRYFISVLCEIDSTRLSLNKPKSEGIGVDLGVKELAIISDNRYYGNINKSNKIKKLEKRLKYEQKSLSRKTGIKNKQKNILRIQRIHKRLSDIRKSYTQNVVNSLVLNNPQFITIEDLNISGMMKNRHLSKAIQQQNLYYFRLFLSQQCNKYGIELRIVNRFYPSSKLCSCCGNKKTNLKLSDRIYVCNSCGLVIDRDLNAALNLKDCTEYIVV